MMLSATAAGGCISHYTLAPRPTAEVGGLTWIAPIVEAERTSLDRWARVVGSPVVFGVRDYPQHFTQLVLASWNVAVGSGDIGSFVADLSKDYPGSAIVLLLQEVSRSGVEVHAGRQPGTSYGRRHGGRGPDIVRVAERNGMNLYYVPSMRNGDPTESDQDRGNAILATLPLYDLTAIELPFERQRRVAVAATVRIRSREGTQQDLRLVSAHLDNRVGSRRLWFAGGLFARARQARALVEQLQGDDAAVLGGDFNTWFGFGDVAVRETLDDFPDTPLTDGRPTFRNILRLDHLFFRLPDGWTASCSRGPRRYGSDHSPLIARIQIG